MLKWVLLAIASIGVAACGAVRLDDRASPTPSASPSATATSTQTPTATPTPTPTPTAPPAMVSGDPRALSLAEPVRQSGAPCGFVDTLDFPLDPPDGESASGGGDFGRFRARYDGYHAGEDWRYGRFSSFGEPVHAIGHGQVTYAQPLGWGADKGVVIVQHTFRDGRRILSFYGHLDPPSVTLRAAQCVKRGDQVGNIGDPRTSPHLHFEMRAHLPDTPGPGYWPSDPRRAGWVPPSATIWFERMSALPGVAWSLASESETVRSLGAIDGTLLISVGGDEVLALEASDGMFRWRRSLPAPVVSLSLDAEAGQVYAGNGEGTLAAFSLTALENGMVEDPIWSLDLGRMGVPELKPIPGDGMLVTVRSRMMAVSGQGQVHWERETPGGILHWAQTGTVLLGLARDQIWSFDLEGATSWPSPISGQRIVASEEPFAYAEDGLYRLRLESQVAEMFYPLSEGFPRSGDLTELPQGGLLVAHRDLDDFRLIAVDQGGSLIWERSIASLQARTVEFLAVEQENYLVVQSDAGRSNRLDIYRVQADTGALTRVLSGGSRSSNALQPEFRVAGNLVLIGLGDAGVFAWDPDAALKAVSEG